MYPLVRKPRCRECRSTKLDVSEETHQIRTEGKNVTVVTVVCTSCKHVWESKDPQLVSRSGGLQSFRQERST